MSVSGSSSASSYGAHSWASALGSASASGSSSASSASASSSASSAWDNGEPMSDPDILKDPAYEFPLADLLPPDPGPDEEIQFHEDTEFYLVIDTSASTENLLMTVDNPDNPLAPGVLKPIHDVLGSFAIKLAEDMLTIDRSLDICFYSSPDDDDGYEMWNDQTGALIRSHYRDGRVYRGGGGTCLSNALTAVFKHAIKKIDDADRKPPIGIVVVTDGSVSKPDSMAKVERVCKKYFHKLLDRGYHGDNFGISFLTVAPNAVSEVWQRKNQTISMWTREAEKTKKFYSDLDDHLKTELKNEHKKKLKAKGKKKGKAKRAKGKKKGKMKDNATLKTDQYDFVDHKTLREASRMGTRRFMNHIFTD